MKSPTLDARVTALARLAESGAKVRFRAKAMEELVLAGDEEGLPFAVEMLREAVSGIDFWFTKLEEAAK